MTSTSYIKHLEDPCEGYRMIMEDLFFPNSLKEFHGILGQLELLSPLTRTRAMKTLLPSMHDAIHLQTQHTWALSRAAPESTAPELAR